MSDEQTTTAAPKRTQRTITLTDRAPVRIIEQDWPTIASASDHDGAVKCQASEVWSIRVRRHADGRALVYAVRHEGPGGQHPDYEGARGGELLAAGADVAAAIRRVGESCGIPEPEIAGCIADLPAEDLV